MNFKLLSFLMIALSIGFTSCSDDDDSGNATVDTLTVDLTGLENLGAGYAYEGWVIVDGAPVSTGVFNVSDDGNLSDRTFTVPGLADATTFVLTIEPSPDSDPSPSAVHLVAGDFNGNTATLDVGHGAAINNDFESSTGKFILATPTDSDDSNEYSGVWFLDNSSGAPAVGLDLPELPEGWIYEGWAVIDGSPVTTGKFSSVTGADQAAPYSGPNSGPSYPGEDFLLNAPAGKTFPTNLEAAVISIEPVPDNSAAPFLLKPLVGPISADAEVHSALSMNNNATATNPQGTVTRN